MKNVLVVYLTTELGAEQNLVLQYKDGTFLPKIGEFVYLADTSMTFQIKAREHLYVNSENLRIIYRLERPTPVDDALEEYLNAKLIQLD
jgi:hypothetical protein